MVWLKSNPTVEPWRSGTGHCVGAAGEQLCTGDPGIGGLCATPGVSEWRQPAAVRLQKATAAGGLWLWGGRRRKDGNGHPLAWERERHP